MISVALDPKIKSVEQGNAWMSDFVKNPPKSPIEAVKMFADVTGATGALTTAAAAIIPGASFIMPALSGILSLFGGGGPTIGEITLNAISDLSRQVNAVAAQLQKALTAEIEASAQKTIDVVLSGQTEIARQQSAAQVIASAVQASILDEAAQVKQEAYAQFLNDAQALQQSTIEDLKKMLSNAQAAVNQYYDSQLSDVISQISQLIAPFLAMFQKWLDNQKTPAPATRAIIPAAAPASNLQTPPDSGTGSNVMPFLIAGVVLLIVVSQKDKKN